MALEGAPRTFALEGALEGAEVPAVGYPKGRYWRTLVVMRARGGSVPQGSGSRARRRRPSGSVSRRDSCPHFLGKIRSEGWLMKSLGGGGAVLGLLGWVREVQAQPPGPQPPDPQPPRCPRRGPSR